MPPVADFWVDWPYVDYWPAFAALGIESDASSCAGVLMGIILISDRAARDDNGP